MGEHSSVVPNRRADTIKTRFVEFGCSERFELVEILDSQHVKIRCKGCGNVFQRHTTFLNQSSSHNIECRACGTHADGSHTPPLSERKTTIDKEAIIACYQQGFGIEQTAAKFKVNARRIARIIDKAGIRRGGDVCDGEEGWAVSRARSKASYHAQAKPKREKVIRERFEQVGCADRFEIAQITDRTHIVIRCLECGREFKRQTAFLDTGKYTNIGCPECGIHADGTHSHAREFNKEVDEHSVADCYESGFSITQTGRKFGISHNRVNAILENEGVPRRDAHAKGAEADGYIHELTGDPFLDEEFVCGDCGRLFTRHDYMVNARRKRTVYTSLDYCSKKCRRLASEKIKRQVYGNRKSRSGNERRRQLHEIPLVDLMERDEGICQICKEPVDLFDVRFDDNGNTIVGGRYPTTDHLTPVSRGGETTWENVQLAHMECNSRKGDRTMEEFLADERRESVA